MRSSGKRPVVGVQSRQAAAPGGFRMPYWLDGARVPARPHRFADGTPRIGIRADFVGIRFSQPAVGAGSALFEPICAAILEKLTCGQIFLLTRREIPERILHRHRLSASGPPPLFPPSRRRCFPELRKDSASLTCMLHLKRVVKRSNGFWLWYERSAVPQY